MENICNYSENGKIRKLEILKKKFVKKEKETNGKITLRNKK